MSVIALGFGDQIPAALEDLERAVEVLALVRRHHARADQGAAGRDDGVEGHVRVDAGVPEGLPQVAVGRSSPITTGTTEVITSVPSGSLLGSTTRKPRSLRPRWR